MVSNKANDVHEHNAYPWVELGVENQTGRLDRNRFTRCDDAGALKNWRNAHDNKDVYVSRCHFSGCGRDTTYACSFFLEHEAPTIGEARESALGSCDLMSKLWGLDTSSFDICFDGNKTFYVAVPREVFGDPEGPELMTVYRCAARHIRDECAPHINLSVYQPSHMYRLSNSVNSRTGLYALALEYRELADFSVNEVLTLAIHPREEEGTALPAVSDKAVAWIQEAIERVRQANGDQEGGLPKDHRAEIPQSRRAARAARRSSKRSRNRQERGNGHQLLLFDNGWWK